jgi:hypothetical protein
LRHEHRVALFEADPAASPFIEAVFGGFPIDGPLQQLSRAYVDAFDPVKLVPNVENWIKVIKEGFRLPLSFTMESLERDHNGWSEPTLFVVDPASPLDLIDLWNIRQFHPQILPVNLSWIQDAKEFLAEFVQANHRPLPGNPYGVMIETTVQFGRSIVSGDHEKALERGKAILSDAGLSRLPNAPFSMKLWYDRIWTADRDDFVHRPQRAELSAATTDLELNISDEGPDLSCRFTSLSPEFASMYGAPEQARWVNVLKLRSYGTNDTLALTLPSSFPSERARRLRLSEPTIISREGFVLPQKYRQHREYFRLMTGREAVIEWLKHHGVHAQPSDPGRIAEQVLSSLNGFWGTNLLADGETIKLLDEMAKSVRKHADGKVEEFPDRSIEVKRWRDLVNRRSTDARHGYGASLDAFIEANMFRLGLVLTCTNCRKKNWFGIEHLKERLTCERCLKTYPFPQGSLNFQQTPWQYRVVGPYSVPNYAEGAYSTVLALSVFARRLGGHDSNITYATGLDFKIEEDAPFEVDFTFWYQRSRMFGREEEPVLVFGEAKSFAVESFKKEDVARMRKLADIFPGAFMVFATLKDEFSATEKTGIGHFALWGRERLRDGRPRTPVIVLTATELFCNWDLEQTWEALGGQRANFVTPAAVRLDNLWTLADLTQQIYLDLPDPHPRFVAPLPPAPAASSPA